MRLSLIALCLCAMTLPATAQAPTKKASSPATKQSAPPNQTAKQVDDSAAAGAALAGFGIAIWLAVAVASLVWIAIPIMIALMRGHPNTAAIAAVSILLGWCIIGWVWALIWSLTTPPHMHDGVYRRR